MNCLSLSFESCIANGMIKAQLFIGPLFILAYHLRKEGRFSILSA